MAFVEDDDKFSFNDALNRPDALRDIIVDLDLSEGTKKLLVLELQKMTSDLYKIYKIYSELKIANTSQDKGELS